MRRASSRRSGDQRRLQPQARRHARALGLAAVDSQSDAPELSASPERIARSPRPANQGARRARCSGARSTSAKWTPAPATAAKSKSIGLNSPIYDIERFGIHFVASPRHADMLLVTGPVTRNMELALRKTYEATPEPRFGRRRRRVRLQRRHFRRRTTPRGARWTRLFPWTFTFPAARRIPHALLHGILLAIGRVKRRA